MSAGKAEKKPAEVRKAQKKDELKHLRSTLLTLLGKVLRAPSEPPASVPPVPAPPVLPSTPAGPSLKAQKSQMCLNLLATETLANRLLQKEAALTATQNQQASLTATQLAKFKASLQKCLSAAKTQLSKSVAGAASLAAELPALELAGLLKAADISLDACDDKAAAVETAAPSGDGPL